MGHHQSEDKKELGPLALEDDPKLRVPTGIVTAMDLRPVKPEDQAREGQTQSAAARPFSRIKRFEDIGYEIEVN